MTQRFVLVEDLIDGSGTVIGYQPHYVYYVKTREAGYYLEVAGCVGVDVHAPFSKKVAVGLHPSCPQHPDEIPGVHLVGTGADWFCPQCSTYAEDGSREYKILGTVDLNT